jgi:hypothetical protein
MVVLLRARLVDRSLEKILPVFFLQLVPHPFSFLLVHLSKVLGHLYGSSRINDWCGVFQGGE